MAELICRGGWPESADWPGARGLRANRGQVDVVARVGVIVASGYGYTRPDGVGVIPIGALGP